ncbi:hypothetical protein GQX74_004021 [Glossina fuscipes]|nr:hypothetical protein GQX74_004021 [Glossina fuscipes]
MTVYKVKTVRKCHSPAKVANSDSLHILLLETLELSTKFNADLVAVKEFILPAKFPEEFDF